MTTIICLANSRKQQGRCIAGISPETGKWIRPVALLQDGEIPWSWQRVDGVDVQLLDIIEIPLVQAFPMHGFHVENMAIVGSDWHKVGRSSPDDLVRYCETTPLLFYNTGDRVPLGTLQQLPPADKRSLQLISVKDASFRSAARTSGQDQIRVTFTYGHHTYDLAVTDPVAEQRVRQRTPPIKDCLLTVSLGGPWKEDQCYKLVAGVIEAQGGSNAVLPF